MKKSVIVHSRIVNIGAHCRLRHHVKCIFPLQRLKYITSFFKSTTWLLLDFLLCISPAPYIHKFSVLLLPNSVYCLFSTYVMSLTMRFHEKKLCQLNYPYSEKKSERSRNIDGRFQLLNIEKYGTTKIY